MGDTEELRALLEGIPARTLAAKLRALMPVIESRIEAGVRHHEIVAVLNQNGGFTRKVTPKTLQCYLYRYRKAQLGASREPHRQGSVSCPRPWRSCRHSRGPSRRSILWR